MVENPNLSPFKVSVSKAPTAGTVGIADRSGHHPAGAQIGLGSRLVMGGEPLGLTLALLCKPQYFRGSIFQ